MATTKTATSTPARTQTYILSFDPKDERAVRWIEALKVMDFFKVEESPYNPDFVAKIERAKSSKKHEVDVATIWD